VASWYGPGYHGKRTASGERFNQNALTAAHRWLPFGTHVRVTLLSTGRSVTVRINDRIPRKDRVIDLSRAAARKIGLIGPGTGRVRIVVE
jgi:rare lipoprotein A